MLLVFLAKLGPTATAEAGIDHEQGHGQQLDVDRSSGGSAQPQADDSPTARTERFGTDLYQIVVVRQEAQDDSFVSNARTWPWLAIIS